MFGSLELLPQSELTEEAGPVKFDGRRPRKARSGAEPGPPSIAAATSHRDRTSDAPKNARSAGQSGPDDDESEQN